jgi:hypothetical protein
MLPSALVAAAVPVPEVVPPALSTVNEIELSIVPVTVSVPLDVAAIACSESTATIATAYSSGLRNKVILLEIKADATIGNAGDFPN